MKKILMLFCALTIAAPLWIKDAVSQGLGGVAVELKGPADAVSALAAKLKKNKAYKAAACESPVLSAESARIDCAKVDSRLMAFLGKHAPATVQWSISSASSEARCLPGCIVMNCPPPGGTLRCCKTATYQPC